jgi:MFS family permease
MSARQQNMGVAVWQTPGAVMLLVSQLLMSIRDMPLGSFLVVYLQAAQYAPGTISQIVSGAQVTGMLVAVLAGRFAQRWSSKHLWMIGIAVAGINGLVFAVDVWWWVVLCWLIGGAGASLASISGSSVLTGIGKPAAMGLLSSLFVICFTVGGVLGNPLAGWLIGTWSYTAYSAFLITMTIVGIVLIQRFIPQTTTVAASGLSNVRFDWAFMRQPSVYNILAMRGLATINYGMIMVLIPLRLNELTNDVYVVAVYGSVMLFVASLTQFVVGRIADRWGALMPTLVAFATMIVCGIILALGASSVPVLFVCGVISNAAAWGLLTLMYVWVADWIAPERHALVFGWLHAVWNISMIIGALIGGALVSIMVGLPFVVTGLLNVLSLMCAWWLYHLPRSSSEAQ